MIVVVVEVVVVIVVVVVVMVVELGRGSDPRSTVGLFIISSQFGLWVTVLLACLLLASLLAFLLPRS